MASNIFSKARDYIQGTYNHFLDQHNHLDPHIKEQALYRASLCEPCLANGACTKCGCKTPDMFFSPNKEDEDLKWGKMVSKEEWELFKAAQTLELLEESAKQNFNKQLEELIMAEEYKLTFGKDQPVPIVLS